MTIPAALKSRKLWLAVLSALTFVVQGDNAAAVAVILGYLGANVADKKLNGAA